MFKSGVTAQSSGDLSPSNTTPATNYPPFKVEDEQSQSENLSSSEDDNNNNRNTQQPLPRSDTNKKLAELRLTIDKLKWITNHQRKILERYDDLAQKHAELKCEFDLISLENIMLRLDLERERWTHLNEKKAMKLHLDRRRRGRRTNVRSKSFLERATSAIQAGLRK